MFYNKKLLVLFLFAVIYSLSVFMFLHFGFPYKKQPEGSVFIEFGIDQESLIKKYPFNQTTLLGVRRTYNFENRVDIWGRFVGLKNNKLIINILGDNREFIIPEGLQVLYRNSYDSDILSIPPTKLVKYKNIVLTLQFEGTSYKVVMIQIPLGGTGI